MPAFRVIINGYAGEKVYDFGYSDCSFQRYGSGPTVT